MIHSLHRPLATLILVFLLISGMVFAAETEAEAIAAEPAGISGLVIGPDGKPASGAKVWLVHAAEPISLQEGVTGEDGRFRFDEIEGTNFILYVLAPGAAPATIQKVTPGTDHAVELTRGTGCTVTVLDDKSGTPVPGATVRVAANISWQLGHTAQLNFKTDDAGIAHLTNLPPESMTIRAFSPVHASSFQYYDNTGGAKDECTLPDIPLIPGGHLSGIVLDPDGEPIPLVTMHLGSMALDREIMKTRRGALFGRSGTDGSFRFDGLPAGTGYRLIARKSGYSPSVTELPDIKAGTALDKLEIRLIGGATITGRLVDPDDQPVSALDKAILDPEEAKSKDPLDGRKEYLSGDRVKIDETGIFTLKNLPTGKHTLTLEPKDHVAITRAGIDLKDGKTHDLGVITALPGRLIAGRVQDTAGKAVPKAAIGVTWRDDDGYHARNTDAGEDGSYKVGGLPDKDTFTVHVQAKGFASDEREQTAPRRDLDFTLVATGGVRGIVHLADGTPSALFKVAAFLEPEANADYQARLLASRPEADLAFKPKDGGFEITTLPPGRYRLEAKASGWAPGKISDIEVVSGDPTDVGVIVLERGLEIQGTVINSDGVPVARAGVTANLPATLPATMRRESGDTSISDEDGRFVIGGLEAGSYKLKASHAAYSPAEEAVILNDDELTPDVTLRLTAGGAVEGLVLDETRSVVSGVRVMLNKGIGLSEKPETRLTDSEGSFRFPRLSPGSYIVMLVPEDGTDLSGMRMKNVEVKDGETVFVTFGDEAAIRLSGLVRKGNQPVPEAAVVMILKSEAEMGKINVKTTSSDEQGRYAVDLDGPGVYVVQVMRQGNGVSPAGSTELEVPDEPDVNLDIVLPGAGISGIIQGEDNQPVGGATVAAAMPGAGKLDIAAQGSALSIVDGSYQVSGIRPGIYQVTVSAPGYAPGSRAGVEVPEGGIASVDFQLERGRSVNGRVIDPHGNPVAGAMVVGVQGGQATVGTTMSGSEGSFLLTLGEGQMIDLVVVGGEFAPALVKGVTLSEEDDAVTVVRLTGGGRIRGIVTTSDGTPLEGKHLLLTYLDSRELDEWVKFVRMQQGRSTDASGSIMVDMLPTGRYRVQIGEHPELPGVEIVVTDGGETVVELVAP